MRASRSDRLATVAFMVAAAIAVPVILHANRDQWFFLDEWDFLAARGLGFRSVMEPHNEHWTSLPIVAYRLVFRVVGLNHYWPYQLMVVGAHVAVAALARVTMRRAGVDAWIATAATVAFLFFGSGRENLGWAFQICFVGSIALGFGAVLLADGDDRTLRLRDGLAVTCGLGALMCSGIGVPMVAGLGVSALLRRGWRVAVALSAPLAFAYGLWFAAFGDRVADAPRASAADAARLVWGTVRATFGALGLVPGAGLALAAVTVVGAGLAVRSWVRPPARASDRDRADDPDGVAGDGFRARYAPTAGLLVAAAGFLLTLGWGRAGVSPHPAGRYLHVLAALLLPTVAVAASALAARRRVLVPVLVVLLLVGLPGNVERLTPTGGQRYTLGSEPDLLALAEAALHSPLPDDYRPDVLAPEITLGWLRDGRRRGAIPEATGVSETNRQAAELLLALERRPGRPRGCRAAADPIRLRAGDSLVIEGVPAAQVGRGFVQRWFGAVDPHRTTIVLRAVRDTPVRVVSPDLSAEVCRAG